MDIRLNHLNKTIINCKKCPRLIEYVKVIETPHAYDTDLEANRRDFKKFYTQYDIRRNKTIRIFPKEFLEWYDEQ